MKVEEFKKKLEEKVKEYIWCLGEGIEKKSFGEEYSRFSMIVYDVVEKSKGVLVGIGIKFWGVGKIDCRELVELKKLIEVGNGGSWIVWSVWERGESNWDDWRFRIEKDEDCNEDGWYIDEEKGEVGFWVNGWLNKERRTEPKLYLPI